MGEKEEVETGEQEKEKGGKEAKALGEANAPQGGAGGQADGQIALKVIDIVVEQLDVSPDQVTMETRFVDDLGADSLDQAEIVMEFEDEFGLDIPEDQENIRTVGDAVQYIVKQLARKKAGEQD